MEGKLLFASYAESVQKLCSGSGLGLTLNLNKIGFGNKIRFAWVYPQNRRESRAQLFDTMICNFDFQLSPTTNCNVKKNTSSTGLEIQKMIVFV